MTVIGFHRVRLIDNIQLFKNINILFEFKIMCFSYLTFIQLLYKMLHFLIKNVH